MLEDFKDVWNAVIGVLLAIAGGLARVLNAKNRTKHKLGYILSELFISAFGGIMAFLLTHAAGLVGPWIGLVCGIAGWTSPKLLNFISSLTEKLLGAQKDELKK